MELIIYGILEINRKPKEYRKTLKRSKLEELEILLLQIQSKIDRSPKENKDLLSAKTMITSRLASRRSK
jgi:hypothetical protein